MAKRPFDLILEKFNKAYVDYQAQPNVYLLITHHLDDPSYQSIIRIALTHSEAKEWLKNAHHEGMGKSIKKILIYKKSEFEPKKLKKTFQYLEKRLIDG